MEKGEAIKCVSQGRGRGGGSSKANKDCVQKKASERASECVKEKIVVRTRVKEEAAMGRNMKRFNMRLSLDTSK